MKRCSTSLISREMQMKTKTPPGWLLREGGDRGERERGERDRERKGQRRERETKERKRDRGERRERDRREIERDRERNGRERESHDAAGLRGDCSPVHADVTVEWCRCDRKQDSRFTKNNTVFLGDPAVPSTPGHTPTHPESKDGKRSLQPCPGAFLTRFLRRAEEAHRAPSAEAGMTKRAVHTAAPSDTCNHVHAP